MKTVILSQILVYYDGPQVVEAHDDIGGRYIGVAIEHNDAEFLVVGVEPERLRQFRGGTIDLLSLITDRSIEIGWQLATSFDASGTKLKLGELFWENIDQDYLPAPGFVLHGSSSAPDLVRRAQEVNKLIMDVTLDPPEAVEHRINSDTLGQFLLVFQRMLKHAYRPSTRGQAQGQFSPSAYKFAVAGFKPGSVLIELQPGPDANLFGAGSARSAVQTVLRLIASTASPDLVVQEVINNRGHLVSAFVNLLDVLIEHDTRLQVDWADGLSETVETANMTTEQAKKARASLRSTSQLEGEVKIITGILKKADVNRGTWRLQTAEESFSGISPEDGPTLSGLETDSRYQFTCTERIELYPSGRERSVLTLEAIEKA